MQKLAEISIKRPVFAAMIILALVVVGAASYFRLGVDRFPSMDLPSVTVRVTLRGASPEQMESEVVERIEEAVNTVEGIEELRSVCGQGTAWISATFALSRNIDVAAQDVRDRVATVIKDLPDDTDPPIVSKFDNDSQPVLTLALSGNRSKRELTEIADRIVKTQIQEQLPADVKLEIIRDQSEYIYSALHEITVHLILGAIMASLVVLAFMRSWRSTIIAAVAIPASVIATFGMMYALNFTLNSVTMLALVLMVGVVIDDAIVVLENVFRFVEEKKMRPFEAAKAATAEIGLAVLATTLSLVVIFVRVSFMSSISGRFLYQFGLTAAASVMVSLLVSFSLTPMMCARLLRAEKKEEASSRKGFYGRLDHAYEKL